MARQRRRDRAILPGQQSGREDASPQGAGHGGRDVTTALVEHDYYDRTPISARKPFRWPDDATVAFAIVVCLETYEVAPPKGAFLPPNLPGGFGRAPYPDVRAFSQREYGHRVGIFRIIDALEQHKLKATAAID